MIFISDDIDSTYDLLFFRIIAIRNPEGSHKGTL